MVKKLKINRFSIAAVAAGVAVATLLSPVLAYAGDGGGGGEGGGGGQGGIASIHWIYRESWPATTGGVHSALAQAGYPVSSDPGNDPLIESSLNQALNECRASYTGSGAADCRLVSVGFVGNDDSHTWNHTSNWEDTGAWVAAWDTETAGKSYSFNGNNYDVQKTWTDKTGTRSVTTLAAESIARAPGAAIRVLVLAQNQPVGEVPPAPPTKTITPGTSADKMTNTTTITSQSGVGGKKMVFTDQINPRGVQYSTGNYKVTDNGADVTGSFSYAHNGDTVTATWNGGDLPNNHEYKFSLDIVVNTPDFNKVSDVASVTWNDKGTGSTDSHDFPTWRPNPDKSWVKQDASGKWQAVIDPNKTNTTGADNNVFLDGDVVASVVNGTIAANLAQAPQNMVLSDDWAKADYIFDAADVAKIRVYEADANTDTQSSVSDIANTGKDVTDQFAISVQGTKATASAKAAYLGTLKGLAKPKQLTLLIPGTINFANGKGAQQVRSDFGKAAGDELTFCTNPNDAKNDQGDGLTNTASQTINSQTIPTNEPKICGYVPPVQKDVIGESSQGGDQSSVDGKVVYPGQRVEYQLLTTPQLPQALAYGIKSVSFTDSYDQYLKADKQTLELMDLNTGKVLPKSKYTSKWDDIKHMFTLTVSDPATLAAWKAGSNPRVQLRFEGTVDEAAPTDHKVNNQWVLTLNNSLTPSNEVFNIPPDINPDKQDNQGKDQGDPTISIDGKTLMLGDTGTYVVNIDAKQANQAYNVWRLGAVDDFDDQYVSIDPAKIELLGADGKDYTSQFNIKLIDGVVYAFAKTVDTQIPATGETVKGDPQPTDLKAYSELTDAQHNALTDPAIDQKLLGQTYQLVMPYKVIKVTDGYVVKNKATEVINNVRKDTNEVSNPLKPINPAKDVVVKVGGESINGQSVYLNSTFLYQLDSSVIPANRAYPQVTKWSIVDPLNPSVDQYTGQWAVYATRDLYKDGKLLTAKGERLDSSFFTVAQDDKGVVTVEASDAYKALVSADNSHEAGFRAYIQVKRIKVTDRQDNQFTEYYNDKVLPSNPVWTRTPDLTPSLHIVKWDAKSGIKDGDRNLPSQALNVDGDTDIVFTITNTSKDDNGAGAVFQAKDLKLEDHTIAGDGTVVDFKYPANWDTLVLRPGQSVDVHGTLQGVTKVHTDRAQVTGVPLVTCPTSDNDPFGTSKPTTPANAVNVDGKTLCSDTKVTSNQDDWNGKHESLGQTGSAVMGMLAVVTVLTAGGVTLMVTRRKHNDDTRHIAAHSAQ